MLFLLIACAAGVYLWQHAPALLMLLAAGGLLWYVVTYRQVNQAAFRSPAGSRPRKDGVRTSRPGYYMPVYIRHLPH